MSRLFLVFALFCSIQATKVEGHGYRYAPVAHHYLHNNAWVGWGGFGWWGGPIVRVPVYGYSYTPVYYYPRYIPSYGALAFSMETGKYGFSNGAPYRRTAEETAIYQCGASDCRSIVWVQGGCAVIAYSQETKSIGWAYADSKYMAQRLAVRGCAVGSRDCTPVAFTCAW
ncbi:MAG: DUF4189 domain-containing protein [Deltaproteobacteria bacterium]|nr:DUF4189 domain-containing protein [Deltaproteobacteria bacterium]MBI3293305.1 DUF4189 domain-containing protein [Deltaproteobacteria bacterium]